MMVAFEVGPLERQIAKTLLGKMASGLDDDTALRGLRLFEREILPYVYYGDKAASGGLIGHDG